MIGRRDAINRLILISFRGLCRCPVYKLPANFGQMASAYRLDGVKFHGSKSSRRLRGFVAF